MPSTLQSSTAKVVILREPVCLTVRLLVCAFAWFNIVELSAGVWNIRAFGVLASSSGGQYSICLFDTDVGSTIPYSCSSPCFSGGADTCTLDTGIVYRVTRPTIIKMSAEGDSPNTWWFGTSGAFGLPKTPLFRISATFERSA